MLSDGIMELDNTAGDDTYVMSKQRLEAFTDGVLAVVITIMAIELKPPHSSNLSSLSSMVNVFISFTLSFAFVGIYWSNHHHLFHAVEKVNGWIIMANLHFLFWICLVPATTSWMGETGFKKWSVIFYGIDSFMLAVSYTILVWLLVAHHGNDSVLAQSLASDWKGKLSLAAYGLGIGLSFINGWIGFAIYVAVACIWAIPDRRFEKIPAAKL